MFAFFPYNTDAPVYYWPFATIGLILVNTIAFFLTVMDPAAAEPWILQYGQGLHPLQWVTSNFIHGGIAHLLGNMMFLWVFGLVVEGKLGWWRFLLVYFGLGGVQCAIEQVVTLSFDEGGSLGASGVIFGLMAMSLVWAPKNEINFAGFVLVLMMFRAFTFELSIQTMSLVYVGMDVLFAALAGFEIGTSILHLLGGGLGLVLGIVMFRKGWVDCEGWDLFSVWKGKHRQLISERLGSSLQTLPTVSNPTVDDSPVSTETPKKTLGKFRKCLEADQGIAAAALYSRLMQLSGTGAVTEAELMKLIDLTQAEQVWADTVSLMEDYLRRFQLNAVNVRLRLARIVIEAQQRPGYSLKLLAEIPPESLPESLRRVRDRIEQKAISMKDEGMLELEGRSW